LDKFIECADNKFVSNEKFEPIKKIVYGIVSFVLIAFLSALISLVFLR